MTNLRDAETRVALGYSGTLTNTERGNWHGYQKYDVKIHHVTLSDTSIIPGLHKKSIVTLALQKVFQVTLRGEALIIKKTSINFALMKKWQTTASKEFF